LPVRSCVQASVNETVTRSRAADGSPARTRHADSPPGEEHRVLGPAPPPDGHPRAARDAIGAEAVSGSATLLASKTRRYRMTDPVSRFSGMGTAVRISRTWPCLAVRHRPRGPGSMRYPAISPRRPAAPRIRPRFAPL